jgi:hypothetical protein
MQDARARWHHHLSTQAGDLATTLKEQTDLALRNFGAEWAGLAADVAVAANCVEGEASEFVKRSFWRYVGEGCSA